MKSIKVKLLALAIALSGAAKADEGMWLLQMMKEQHSIELMKKAGLELNENDLYNPDGVSMKDAVGIFGSGCTGEIISSKGLILTNHHCGYGAIQQHSSVEHDYLTDGFWAMSNEEEIPTPGLTFKFIDRIVDVTDIINEKISKGEISETESMQYEFLEKLEKELFEASDLKEKPGIETILLPFYEGNRFFMFYIKVYSDIRMVAAPPSSVGKFGGETDNWMWPRHTGDFSIFRIYADKDGNPAEYNENNIPLNTEKHFTISLQGIEEGDYSMIMGFPGSTERYLTRSEVEMRMKSENEPRIAIREARLGVLREAMSESDKIRIQYASKFASSSNYWKNSIGMNKALVENKVLESKSEQESKFLQFAGEIGNNDYKTVVKEIDNVINEEASRLTYLWTCGLETYIALEFKTPASLLDTYIKACKAKDGKQTAELKSKLLSTYDMIYNKDYDHEVDRNVAKAVLPLYAELVGKERPDFYNIIDEKYNGNYSKFIDELYENSIFSSRDNLEKFLKKPSQKVLDKDLGYLYSKSFLEKILGLQTDMEAIDKKLAVPHKTYIRGLVEMKQKYQNLPSYPDANFTLRLTYGNVKSYIPRDGVFYNYYTTMEGIMQKEDPTNPEFVVPEKLKEIYNKKDFGPYALKDGRMPVAFITTNDITGGNSGSPVIDSKGRLIGCAFDGNWESLSGDIHFDNKLQRCICVDIRYVLFIIDKFGGCKRLIDEMTIEK